MNGKAVLCEMPDFVRREIFVCDECESYWCFEGTLGRFFVPQRWNFKTVPRSYHRTVKYEPSAHVK